MKPHILVIDDEEPILTALERVLTRENYIVTTTAHPTHIEKILKTQNIDAIITDIMMEEMSGLDIVKKVKKEYPFIPVILITGNPNLNSAQEAIRRQAFDYIKKPVERNKILEVVKKAVQYKKKLEQEEREKEKNKQIAEDLTRRNQDLSTQNARILDATTDFVITFTQDNVIFYANRAARERFERPNIPLVGSKVLDFVPEDKKESYSRMIDLAVKYSRYSIRQRIELVVLDKYNQLVEMETSFCHYTIDGVDYYTCISRDTTEKKILVQKLIESEKRAILTTLAASIGHEINNAITAILGFAEVAQSPTASIQVKDQAIQVTIAQAEKLRNLTYNLLTLGKSNKPFSPNEVTKVDLNVAIQNVLELFEKSSRLKYCHLEVDLSKEPLWVVCTQESLELILTNLILNAADATNNKGKIKIKSGWSNGEPYLMVEDNGIGMTEEVQKKIYEPYFTTKEVGKGTGLGMFVVKETANRYGIRIHMESEVNKGSKFTLVFKNATNHP